MIKNTIEAPLWPSVNTIPTQYPWLSADDACEVAVLGGGITAAMCAMRFAEAGIDTVLVSASPLGFGGSACSSGMMTLGQRRFSGISCGGNRRRTGHVRRRAADRLLEKPGGFLRDYRRRLRIPPQGQPAVYLRGIPAPPSCAGNTLCACITAWTSNCSTPTPPAASLPFPWKRACIPKTPPRRWIPTA